MCEGSTRKPLEEIASKKRSMYRKRYEMLDDLSEKGKSQQVWNDEIMGYIDLYRCSFLICEII